MRILKRLWFWLQWPGLFVYFRLGPRTRVLVERDNNVLVVRGAWLKLYGDEGWALPGGGLHRGEDPASGAARELREELSLIVDPTELRSIGSTYVSERGIGYVAHCFILNVPNGQTVQPDGREITELAWINPSTNTNMPLKPEVRLALELSKR